MSMSELLESVKRAHAETYGREAETTAYAPGRVNLLGEHTDYNGGFVLPMPLSLGTAVAISKNDTEGLIEISSSAFEGTAKRSLSESPSGHWSDYVLGSLIHLLDGREVTTGLSVMVATNLPVGSGLSSSAALEVATMRAICKLFDIELSPVDIAILARKAENQFMGMPCGIMDQFSVSVGTPGSAVALDTRTLEYKPASLPDTHHVVVTHSGVGHKLTDGGYEQRVAECNAACEQLGVELLSDLGTDDLARISALPDPLGARARHIVTENARVKSGVEALAAGDTQLFSKLMIESHISQSDDYAVSLPEIDALVEGAIAAGASGARLTGGGFGGSIVALVEKGKFDDWRKAINSGFPEARIIAIT